MKSLSAVAVVVASMFFAKAARADDFVVTNQGKVAINCAKTPDVSIAGNQNTITTTGTCRSISISGNQNTVNGTATSVSVSGNDNIVTITADQVSITGNTNTVTVPKAIKLKKPRVSNLGNDNTVK